MISDIEKVVGLVVLALSGVVWLIRLEGKVKQVERAQVTDIDRINKTLEKLEIGHQDILKTLSVLSTNIAEIMGYERGRNEQAPKTQGK